MNMKKTLDTTQLFLRPLAADDFGAVHSWASNPANTRYMAWGPNTEAQTRAFLETVTEGKDFAVVLKDTGRVIGSCGLYPDADNDTGVLGWILHEAAWRRGFGTELAGELIRYGFRDLGLRRIVASCAADNRGSWRVMEKNGMRREAVHRRAFLARVDREWIDSAEYAILAEEYDAGPADRSMTGETEDCCFQAESGVFNYRVGAIILRDGCLLMTTNNRVNYYYTLGGRVRFGETTETALQREVSEEIGTACRVGQLALVHENLFEESGTRYHEIALFFFADLPADAVLRDTQPAGNGLVERFEWLPIDSLHKVALYPEILRTEIHRLQREGMHVATHEWT